MTKHAIRLEIITKTVVAEAIRPIRIVDCVSPDDVEEEDPVATEVEDLVVA